MAVWYAMFNFLIIPKWFCKLKKIKLIVLLNNKTGTQMSSLMNCIISLFKFNFTMRFLK